MIYLPEALTEGIRAVRKTIRLRPRSPTLRWAAPAAALLASCMLAACATTGTTATTVRSQCAAWRAITYASRHDTAETVRQVRVHNRTGEKIGCWQ
jgi:hypothetical protein